MKNRNRVWWNGKINQIPHAFTQYHKKRLFEKEKHSQVTVKQSTVFFSMNDSFEKTPRTNWEIQMDWENGA